jgi:hypothetical protein
MDKRSLLRNYGIVPRRQPTHSGPVRAEFSRGTQIGQWVAFSLFGIGPILLGVLLLIVVPVLVVRLPLFLGFTLFGLLVCWFVAHDANAWVELDEDHLRWKNMFTGRIQERPVNELTEILTMVLAVTSIALKIHENIFGRIRGFEFRFEDPKARVRIFRADPKMTNVMELVEAVVGKLYEQGEVEAETILFDNKPLIKTLRFVPHE